MKPSERLAEVEKWHSLKETIEQVGPQSHFDMNWLIARVKTLEAALKDNCRCHLTGIVCDARKALEGDGE